MPALLALLMIGFWGCGVKTLPKNDALELLPEIPFHSVPEKGAPTTTKGECLHSGKGETHKSCRDTHQR